MAWLYKIILFLVSLSSIKCKNIPDVSLRIINGIDAQHLNIFCKTYENCNSFPYMAHITILTSTDEEKINSKCGATVIHSKILLTAAHCVYNKYLKRYVKPDEVENIIAGTYNLSDPKAVIAVKTVSQVIPHESFNHSTVENDIALLILRNKLVGANVKPIQLPIMYNNRREFIGEDVLIIGWGETEYSKRSVDSLRFSVMTVIELRQFGTQLYLKGRYASTSAGKGDSGGPAVLKDSSSNAVQIGITSYGFRTNNKTDPEKGSVYTNVVAYIPWLKNKLQQFGFTIQPDGHVRKNNFFG